MNSRMIALLCFISVMSILVRTAFAGTEDENYTFYGWSSGNVGATALGNSFFGAGTGQMITTGSKNTLVGHYAGTNMNGGSSNVFLGYLAGSSISDANNLLIIDNCHLYTCNPICSCDQPLIFGDFDGRLVKVDGTIETTVGIKFPDGTTQATAVYSRSNSSLTNLGNNTGTSSGTYGGDVFLGTNAGTGNTTGSYNSFVGISSGTSNNTGSSNSFVGYTAGQNNSSGSNNTFVGNQAGYNSSSGNYDTFIGSTAGGGTNGHPGYSNVFVGAGTGYNNSGSGNVFIGNSAGYSSGSGNFNVFIGTNAAHDVTDSYKLYISSSNSYPTTPLIYGEFDTGLVQINGRLIMEAAGSPSDERFKTNIEQLQSSLDKVMKLNGVTYMWKSEAVYSKGMSEGKHIGFIAQEVEKIIPELVFTDGKGYKALQYDKLVPVLAEAIKEQQLTIKEKDARIDRLEKALESVEKRLTSLESSSTLTAGQ